MYPNKNSSSIDILNNSERNTDNSIVYKIIWEIKDIGSLENEFQKLKDIFLSEHDKLQTIWKRSYENQHLSPNDENYLDWIREKSHISDTIDTSFEAGKYCKAVLETLGKIQNARGEEEIIIHANRALTKYTNYVKEVLAFTKPFWVQEIKDVKKELFDKYFYEFRNIIEKCKIYANEGNLEELKKEKEKLTEIIENIPNISKEAMANLSGVENGICALSLEEDEVSSESISVTKENDYCGFLSLPGFTTVADINNSYGEILDSDAELSSKTVNDEIGSVSSFTEDDKISFDVKENIAFENELKEELILLDEEIAKSDLDIKNFCEDGLSSASNLWN